MIPAALVALFPVIEWVIHVAILHWRPRRLGPVAVDSLLARKHREHHADPRDLPLVFIPWQVLVWLLPAYVVVALLAMPTLAGALSLLVSVYGLKFGYEWTHYLVHSDYRPQSRWFRSVWRNHRLHHYKNEHYWFTVTTAGTADRLFGTYPDPGTVQTSPTVQARCTPPRGFDPRVSIHHLNCATMRPHGSLGGRVGPGSIVAHCLLVERPDGLLLVDTGFGTGDIADPAGAWAGRSARSCARRSTRPRPPGRRCWPWGHRVEDVTDIAVTHLDLDHAGGLADFPRARVHVLGDELDAALRPTCARRRGTSARSGRTARGGSGTRTRARSGSGSVRSRARRRRRCWSRCTATPAGTAASPYAGPTAGGCCTPATPTSTPETSTPPVARRPGCAPSSG